MGPLTPRAVPKAADRNMVYFYGNEVKCLLLCTECKRQSVPSLMYIHLAYWLIHKPVSSLKLIQEVARLLPPYTALGFDHHAIANAQKPRTVTIGELQSIKHLAQYGRPL